MFVIKNVSLFWLLIDLLSECMPPTVVCYRDSMRFLTFFLLRMAVCVYLYTDNTVVLVTCLFPSGCCQRTERRERRACCPGACEWLTVLMHLYLSKWLTAGQKWSTWTIFLCGFVMKSETKVALFKLDAIFLSFIRVCWLKDRPDLKDLLWVLTAIPWFISNNLTLSSRVK